MDSSEEAEALQQMRELLKARLPPEDFKRFKQADIRNLVINKRFEDEESLQKATAGLLQSPPGDALPGLLIEALLRSFHPAELRPTGSSATGFQEAIDELKELPGKVVDALGKLPQKVVDALDEREFRSGTASSRMSFDRFLRTSVRLKLTVRWDESLPQRYLNDQFQVPIVPEFPWGSRGEDEVAQEAVAWLHRHYTPQLKSGRVVWIAVQHVDWLEAEWPDDDVKLPLGKTDYVAVLVDEHSCFIVDAIDSCRATVVAAHQDPTADKKRAAKAASRTMRMHLMGLLPYVLALFEAKTPANLTSNLPGHKAQAGAEYLQLRKMQRDRDCNHPDAPVVLGDFNKLNIFKEDRSDQSKVDQRTSMPQHRSAAAAYVRDLLQEGASGVRSFREEHREHGGPGAAPPEHGGGAAGGAQGSNLGLQPQPEASGAGCGTVQGAGDVMYDECGATHAAAQDLIDYFQLPEVFQALGLKEAPTSAPLWELDAWAESATVVV